MEICLDRLGGRAGDLLTVSISPVNQRHLFATFSKQKVQFSKRQSDLPFRRIDFAPLSAINQTKINKESKTLLFGSVEGAKSFF